MVIDDPDMVGASFVPGEAYSPLIVDADAELAGPISFQGLQAVSGRHAKIDEIPAVVKKTQFRNATFCMSGGNRLLRLPDQISSVS
jgi:hypothetical protein